jgi:plastocyanin
MIRMTIIRAILCVLALTLAACTPAHEPQQKQQYYQVDRATAGSISGAVRFTGTAPKLKPISMNAEQACEEMHPTPLPDPSFQATKDRALQNVFVYIKSGLEGKEFEPPKQAVILDQRGCMFVPRVVGIQTGQTLSVKNSDAVSHNVHPLAKNNREWNQHQAPQSPDLQRRFTRPEVLIPVKCNIHSWMRSHIAVLEHPYFAVTGPTGQFEFPPVPPGAYTVAAWHELYGESSRQVTVGPQSKHTVEFLFQ